MLPEHKRNMYVGVIRNIITLKEIEHRKLGWKALILKYDIGKSLSKVMWCKTADN